MTVLHPNVYDPHLAHYGVKGMKWGVRKSKSDARRSSSGKKVRSARSIKKKSKQQLIRARNQLIVGAVVGGILATSAAIATGAAFTAVSAIDDGTNFAWKLGRAAMSSYNKQTKAGRDRASAASASSSPINPTVVDVGMAVVRSTQRQITSR